MWKRKPPAEATTSETWFTDQVKNLFADPRFEHLKNLADPTIDPGIDDDIDSALFMQAMVGLYQMRSAEAQSDALVRVTRGLAWATGGLVLATVVLVVVTVFSG